MLQLRPSAAKKKETHHDTEMEEGGQLWGWLNTCYKCEEPSKQQLNDRSTIPPSLRTLSHI